MNSLTSLATATRGELIGCPNANVTSGRVVIDSRLTQPGDLFWALRGEHHDGHEFLAEARRRGAGAAVVRRERLDQAHVAWANGSEHEPVPPLIVVEDTLTALAEFACWHRSQQAGLVIGVTGSFGKTTTREMIHAVLSASRSGVRSLKNFNNHIGLPLSLLELDPTHEFAVLEMGASAVGEIAMLAKIAQPEVGVITGIGLAHVVGFGSPEGIVLGKGELLESLPTTGFAVLPGDNRVTRGMAERAGCRVLFVGESDGNQVRGTNVRLANQRLTFEVDRVEYSVPVTGRHFLTAALTALAIAREIGLSPRQIADGFANFQAAPGRCQVHHIGPWTVIDDTYNANPSSMRAACETLRDWQGANKRLLITGDMLELGTHAEEAHIELGRVAAEAGVDGLLALGEQAQRVIHGALGGGLRSSQLAQSDRLENLLTVLESVLEPGDVLLVKGSRGMRMERVIDWLREKATGLDSFPLGIR
ncbi:MAG: UDP-N-acetylmuramoyl-tripeptide--D-alanyl-D-alanine ligase [Planctomycetaceae bacterium]